MIDQFGHKWNRALVVIAINLVALAALGGLYYFLGQQAGALNTTEQALIDRERERRDLGRLEQLMADTAASRQLLAEHFISTKTLPSWLESLDRLASASRVNLNVNSADITTGANPSLGLKFNLTGSFASIYHFLALLDNTPMKIRWTRGDLNQSAQEGPTGGTGWQGNFDLEVLSFQSN